MHLERVCCVIELSAEFSGSVLPTRWEGLQRAGRLVTTPLGNNVKTYWCECHLDYIPQPGSGLPCPPGNEAYGAVIL